MIIASNNPFECNRAIIGEPPYSEEFTWADGDPQTFTVPTGITPKSVFHNRSLLLESEYSVSGQVVTVTYTTFDASETNIITIKN